MPIFMENTQVDDTKTVAEIQALLAARGASSILVEYNLGHVEGVGFRLQVEDVQVPFRLPCRWKAVEALLRRVGKKPRKRDTYERMARRIAWRQILRWVQAQLALIETGMVKAQEVFLPYAMVGQRTLYEMVEQQTFLALPAPKPPADDDGEGHTDG